MHGMHDVFPAAEKEEDDPNSVKKLKKGDGAWALQKDVLGFEFDGEKRTLLLDEGKRNALLSTLKEWTRLAQRRAVKRKPAHKRGNRGGRQPSSARIDFKEFRRVICQLRNAAICVPAGRGLLSESSKLASKETKFVFIKKGTPLYQELDGWRTLLREATVTPTQCTELVSGTPDFIGIVDASTEGVGGIVVGENDAVHPTVFRYEWPEEVRALVISTKNPAGRITNSDLEMAGMFLLLLVIRMIVPSLDSKHLALLDDNSPTVSWVTKMTSKNSVVAVAMLRAMSTVLKRARASPLIPMHIPGDQNSISDIPSRSFGRQVEWHCVSDDDFLTLFDSKFPLPNQNSWTMFQIPSALLSKVVAMLLTQQSEPDEWRRLPKPSANIGRRGFP